MCEARRAVKKFTWHTRATNLAQVMESADMLASGANGRKAVGVQISPWAPSYFFSQMTSKKPLDVKVILKESYIKAIMNSVGSNLFRNLFASVNGKKKDILEDGALSCAAYVSSILYLFKLIADTHATVKGTVADLVKSGWTKTKKPREGAVLVWEAKEFGNSGAHKHIGFYIGKNKAISNSFKKYHPISHHWTFGIHPIKSGKAGTAKQLFDRVKNGRPVRKVEQIFWNKKLDPHT